jgi:hypothetical protein
MNATPNQAQQSKNTRERMSDIAKIMADAAYEVTPSLESFTDKTPEIHIDFQPLCDDASKLMHTSELESRERYIIRYIRRNKDEEISSVSGPAQSFPVYNSIGITIYCTQVSLFDGMPTQSKWIRIAVDVIGGNQGDSTIAARTALYAYRDIFGSCLYGYE